MVLLDDLVFKCFILEGSHAVFITVNAKEKCSEICAGFYWNKFDQNVEE